MSEEADRLRRRAFDCRALATDADVRDAKVLRELADELEAEARRIDGKDAFPD